MARQAASGWSQFPSARMALNNVGAKPKRLWLVVKIEGDVPVMVDVYPDKRSANRRAEFLRQHSSLLFDAVRLVEFKVARDDSNPKGVEIRHE